jgi:TRAP-type C4-dicarboxylate transport system substrate-binding protein
VPTALERGVIDGFGWPTVGLNSLGLEKQVSYRIEPKFYNLADLVFVNNDKWESLSQEARDILMEVALEYEIASVEEMAMREQEDRAAGDAAGVEAVVMEGDGAAQYLSIAFEAMWDRVRDRVGDERTEELRSYLYQTTN